MNTKKMTQLGVLGVVTALIGYDIFVAIEPTDGDTISEIIKVASKDFPLIPFAWGVLTMHLFSRRDWSKYEFRNFGNKRYCVLGAVGATVLGTSFLPQLAEVSQYVWMVAGGAVGFFFWPQFKDG